MSLQIPHRTQKFWSRHIKSLQIPPSDGENLTEWMGLSVAISADVQYEVEEKGVQMLTYFLKIEVFVRLQKKIS